MKYFKKILPALILIGTPLLSLSARAASTCLDKAKVQAITKDFSFFGNAQFDLCDEENPLTKIIQALLFIKDVKFRPSGGGAFNQNVLTEHPYSYFKKRIENIVLDENCESSSVVAYVLRGDNDKTVYICPTFYETSVLERADTLVHEARHQDGFDHVNCTRGSFKHNANNKACDLSYAEKGSYAIGVDFKIKIAHDPEIHPAIRNNARVSASDDLVSRFNILPGDLKDGAFLTDPDRRVSFFDGVSFQKIAQISENQVLIANDYGYFFKDKNSFKEIYLTKWLSPSGRSSDNTKKSTVLFIDVAAGTNYYCYLYSRVIVCGKYDGGSPVKIKFSQIRPVSIFSQTRITGELVLTVTDEDGHIADLPKEFAELEELRESQISLKPNTNKLLKSQDWTGRFKKIALTQDGKLFFWDLNKNDFTPLLPTKTFTNVIAPVVWSSSLQAL